MWLDALAAQQAGRIRTTEVRASDYLEANGLFAFGLAKPILAGRRAYVPTPLYVPHSWTAIADVARTLVTVATDERAWGESWLVPTNPPLTVRELATRYATVMGAPAPKLATIPYPIMYAVGWFNPMVRELRTTRYQFTRPFVIDSSATEQTFGLAPTDLDTVLRVVERPS
jgi:nucleoside-diphosphate-sugar epimerase